MCSEKSCIVGGYIGQGSIVGGFLARCVTIDRMMWLCIYAIKFSCEFAFASSTVHWLSALVFRSDGDM